MRRCMSGRSKGEGVLIGATEGSVRRGTSLSGTFFSDFSAGFQRVCSYINLSENKDFFAFTYK